MNATQWKIDDATTLVRSPAGYSLIWAGCEFPPEPALSGIAEGDLLAQCEAALLTPGTPCERHVCDCGPFGESRTVLTPHAVTAEILAFRLAEAGLLIEADGEEHDGLPGFVRLVDGPQYNVLDGRVWSNVDHASIDDAVAHAERSEASFRGILDDEIAYSNRCR